MKLIAVRSKGIIYASYRFLFIDHSVFRHFSDIWGSLTQSFLYNNSVCFGFLLTESSKEMQ